MTEPISIDIWSDIACPWCYIGKRNLEEGLAVVATDENAPQVNVTFHSYELSPETPVDYAGSAQDFYVKHKGMQPQQMQQMLTQVTEAGKAAGIAYRFDLQQHANTAKAHQLLHHAETKGLQRDLKERLMSAYFIEGKNVGRIDDLVELATEVGLDATEAREALESERHVTDVREDQDQARAYGIQGVPFFVIDGKYGISGAQPAEAFVNVLRDVWAERLEPAAPTN